MEKTTKTVAAATKKETANANATSAAAKTATPKAAAEQPKTAEPAPEAKPAAQPAQTPETKPTPEAQPAPAAAAPSPTAAALAAKEQELKEKNAAKVAAQAAEMQKKQSFEELQKRLKDELSRLNHKKEIADKRDVYLNCGAKMAEYLKKLEVEKDFETKICRLSFEIYEKDNYGREDFRNFMNITNTAIVRKFCKLLKEEIAAKVAELESELLED
jgi:DNA polymerase III gamma/tau subunit